MFKIMHYKNDHNLQKRGKYNTFPKLHDEAKY